MHVKQVFFITNLRFVWYGLILLYQELCNNLKWDPTCDITCDIREALIDFKVFVNIYIVHPHCVLVDCHHPNHNHFMPVFQPKQFQLLWYL